ncbi:MAG: hypothetical protein KKA28_19340 [Planctomycetes bacterium]|nr:hypothetical protein [Planctomycetota bacterium]
MFTNGKWSTNVRTVADAIRELSLLPPDMKMDQECDDNGSDIVVMNRDDPETCHVHFAGGGEWA